MANGDTETAVALATLHGKIDTLTARMEMSAAANEQLAAICRDMLAVHQSEVVDLRRQVATVHDQAQAAVSAVRVDVESKIAAVAEDVSALENWRSSIRGAALAVGVLSGLVSSVVTAVVVKAIPG